MHFLQLSQLTAVISLHSINVLLFVAHTRYVRKVMRLTREKSFNWRYVYTHLIFFKITSLSINTPLTAVLPRVVARLEVLNWDFLLNIRHGSLHVFNSPKMVSFQAGFEPGKQKKSGGGNAAPTSLQPRHGPARFVFVSPAQIQLERTPFLDC